jgi:hypothetical protein
MLTVRQSSDIRHKSREGMSVQDAKSVDAQDSRYPTLSVLYAQDSLQDTKLASCEEQGLSSRALFF